VPIRRRPSHAAQQFTRAGKTAYRLTKRIAALTAAKFTHNIGNDIAALIP
jgi:hypothetical protein